MTDDEEPAETPADEATEPEEDPSLLTTDTDSAGLWLPKGPMPKTPRRR